MQKLNWILMRDCSPGRETFATYIPHVGFFGERPELWKPCSSCTKWQMHLAFSVIATEREETILLGDWNFYMACRSPGVIKAEMKNKTNKVSTCTQSQSPQSHMHMCTSCVYTYIHVHIYVYVTLIVTHPQTLSFMREHFCHEIWASYTLLFLTL